MEMSTDEYYLCRSELFLLDCSRWRGGGNGRVKSLYNRTPANANPMMITTIISRSKNSGVKKSIGLYRKIKTPALR
jgi:hypothetical protein